MEKLNLMHAGVLDAVLKHGRFDFRDVAMLACVTRSMRKRLEDDALWQECAKRAKSLSKSQANEILLLRPQHFDGLEFKVAHVWRYRREAHLFEAEKLWERAMAVHGSFAHFIKKRTKRAQRSIKLRKRKREREREKEERCKLLKETLAKHNIGLSANMTQRARAFIEKGGATPNALQNVVDPYVDMQWILRTTKRQTVFQRILREILIDADEDMTHEEATIQAVQDTAFIVHQESSSNDMPPRLRARIEHEKRNA